MTPRTIVLLALLVGCNGSTMPLDASPTDDAATVGDAGADAPIAIDSGPACPRGCVSGLACIDGMCRDMTCVSPAGECDVYAQDCASSARCEVWTTFAGERSTHCVDTGADAEGDSCTHGTCAAGLTCRGAICRPICHEGLCGVPMPCASGTCTTDAYGDGSCTTS